MFENYAKIESPITKENWRKLSKIERLDLVKEKISRNNKFQVIHPTKANKNGQVFIKLLVDTPASKRGILILSFERILKDSIDQGINVWHEPIGDKNSLRNLRGIEIKT